MGPGPEVWARVRAGAADAPLGLYLHVPFCERRCGYCAFTTVATGDRATDEVAGAHRRWLDGVRGELAAADAVLGPDRPPLTSVYVGGGTPSLLAAPALAAALGEVRRRFAVADELEVSVEANPDSTDPALLGAWATTGVTRVSFGMQSAVPRVLALLDRTHDPERAPQAAAEARAAGIEHVSLDLIHGTPGETAADWARTLAAALDAPVDHLSAYALAVEPGTKLAARVRTGELPEPSGDEAADRYAATEAACRAAGLDWYELSNWARSPAARCRHNLLVWRGHHWWGVGPGAHSHVAGVRWWNGTDVDGWAAGAAVGRPPVTGHEVLTPAQLALERVLLGVRLAEGLGVEGLGATAVAGVVADGLAERHGDRLVLTLRGRLLADLVVHRLTV